MTDEIKQLGEKTIASKEVFSGRLLHVFSDDVLLPDGHKSVRELIRHNGAVAVVPLTDDGYVIAERQFRYPFDRVLTEIPAGKLDGKDEDHLEAAKRELREETGLVADTWISLGPLYPSIAYTDEVIYLYLAKGLKQEKQELDDGEFLNVVKIPLKEMVDLVMDGKIEDAKTQTAILKVARLEGVE